MRRIVREAALDDGAEGSRWLEIQVDPTSYAPFVGGITPALEIVLDEAVRCRRARGGAVGVIVAASRMRHPLEARTLARLAARHAGRGPGTVVGFGLSNDERRGRDRGVRAAPSRSPGGPGWCSCRTRASCSGRRRWPRRSTRIAPDRLGHGVRSVEDPRVLERVVRERGGARGVPAVERRRWGSTT